METGNLPGEVQIHRLDVVPGKHPACETEGHTDKEKKGD
jgi:hypothetical protein